MVRLIVGKEAVMVAGQAGFNSKNGSIDRVMKFLLTLRQYSVSIPKMVRLIVYKRLTQRNATAVSIPKMVRLIADAAGTLGESTTVSIPKMVRLIEDHNTLQRHP